jgi:hypothetical protein
LRTKEVFWYQTHLSHVNYAKEFKAASVHAFFSSFFRRIVMNANVQTAQLAPMSVEETEVITGGGSQVVYDAGRSHGAAVRAAWDDFCQYMSRWVAAHAAQ